MSYASTAQTGSLEQRRSSPGFGKKVGAAVLTVAVGAAIAAGIAVTSSDVTSTGTEIATADRVLANKAPATQSNAADRVLANKAPTTNQSNAADRVLASKAPATTSSWGYPTTVDGLVEQGLIPSQSSPSTFSEAPGQPR